MAQEHKGRTVIYKFIIEYLSVKAVIAELFRVSVGSVLLKKRHQNRRPFLHSASSALARSSHRLQYKLLSALCLSNQRL